MLVQFYLGLVQSEQMASFGVFHHILQTSFRFIYL